MSTLAIRLVTPFLVLLAGGCASALRPSAPLAFTRPLMGTTMSIVLDAASPAEAGPLEAAANAAFDRMAELDAILSNYRPDSELNRLCVAAGGPPVRVGPDLFAVLARSVAFAATTHGAFDITVGPLTQLWRDAMQSGRSPDHAAVLAARRLVDWRRLELDHATHSVRLSSPGMRLDLGAIGKGYAADAAAAELRRRGLRRYLIDAGGSILAGDPPRSSPEGWPVAVKAGLESGPVFDLLLRNRSVAASGDAEQFLELDGVRHSHIIDPRTGEPMRGRTAATVIAPDAAAADALATALAVLGPAGAEELLAARLPGVEARVVVTNGDRRGEWQSPGFPRGVLAPLPRSAVRQPNRRLRPNSPGSKR
jgi:thiamine biosynthesis lipoprotein